MSEQERWRRIEALYHEAEPLLPDERQQFLSRACGGDGALRRDVEVLLAQEADSSADVLGGVTREAVREPHPARIGPYEIHDRIGVGGMGDVFRATDTRLARDVAVKIPHERFGTRTRAEGLAIARLNHPHICTLYDVGPDFLVMELLEGVTLGARLDEGPLSTPELLTIGAQIADALAEAHRVGLVHRDLKPGNVMLTRHGAKVMDFGLAKLSGQTGAPLTQTRAIVGTLAYMAPELVSGGKASVQSDLFALGLILFQMAAGGLPYPGASLGSMLASDARVSIPSLSRLRAGLPPTLERLVVRLLAADPGQRPADAIAVREQLRDLMQRASWSRSRWRGWAAVAALTVAAGIAGWQASTSRNAPRFPAVVRFTPLTTFPGRELQPAISRDGTRVAFSSVGGAGENRDIYVTAMDRPDSRRLTTDLATDSDPAWSPDGTRIAFLRARGAAGRSLVVVPAAGGAERVLAPVRMEDSFVDDDHPLVAWTPDGADVVFTSQSPETGHFGFYAVPSAGGPVRRFLEGRADADDTSLAFSADGSRLAFTRCSGPRNCTLFVQSRGGAAPGAPAPVVGPDVGQSPHSLAWVSGSTRLVFVSGSRVLAWDGATVTPVYSADRILGGMALADTAAGPRAVVERINGGQDIWTLPLDSSGTAVAGEAVRRFRSTAEKSHPRFSPDGSHVVFTSNASGVPEIWRADADGGNARQLTTLGAYIVGFVRWSPDGQRLAFHARLPRDAHVFVMPSNGGPIRDLGHRGVAPSWSADGRSIYFAGDGDVIFRAPVDGGEPERLVEGAFPVESADGKRLIYSKFGRRGLFSRALQGNVSANPEERLVDDHQPPFGGYFPVPGGLYYVSSMADGRPRAFRYFDDATKRAIDLGPAPRDIGTGLTVSSDRRELVYPSGGLAGSDLMAVGFAAAP